MLLLLVVLCVALAVLGMLFAVLGSGWAGYRCCVVALYFVVCVSLVGSVACVCTWCGAYVCACCVFLRVVAD